jgi:hypothetical protein
MSPLPAPPTTTTDAGNNEDMQQIEFSKNSRICSWMMIPCCFSSETSPSWWEQMQIQSPEKNRDQRWWFRGWMKVREWSEIVAGPKWKTFIRRFNNNNKNRNGYVKQGSLNYDPLSYALNFDDGNDGEDGGGYGYGVFSSRFASIPASAKSSMDLGKDAPVIT